MPTSDELFAMLNAPEAQPVPQQAPPQQMAAPQQMAQPAAPQQPQQPSVDDLFAQLNAPPVEAPSAAAKKSPSLLSDITEAFSNAPGVPELAEFASSFNRSVLDTLDFMGPDNVNAVLELAGSETRIPTFRGALGSEGSFLEPGLKRDIIQGAGAAGPAALGFGQLMRTAAKALPAAAAGEGALTGSLREAGRTTAKQDLAVGAAGGAGAVAGEEVGGAPGAIVGSLAAPLAGSALMSAGKGAASRLIDTVRAQPSQEAQDVIKAGVREGVDVLTSDVVPPTSFLGKWTQQMSEKLGPLGSGTRRTRQQVARQNTIESLSKEFDVAIDSDFFGDIVKSLNAGSAKRMEAAQGMRNNAVEVLDIFGKVPVSKTVAAIDSEIVKQQRLGEMGDSSFVNKLMNTREAVSGAADFSTLKNMRTDVIDDLVAVRRGDDYRTEGSLQSIKSAIDKDMAKFANTNGAQSKAAGVEWRKANRSLAEELSLVKDTELRRIFRSGKATPEQVAPILLGGKRSQLNRLNESLGRKGKQAAKAAILQDVLKKSGFQDAQGVRDFNPDRFANALKNPKTQQAIDVFFDGVDRRQIKGITRLLDHTRRAQQAAVATQTGQTTLPIAAFTALTATTSAVSPLVALIGAPSLVAAAKAYESKAMRTFLLKLEASKPNSPAERNIIAQAVPGMLSGLQNVDTDQLAQPVE